MSKVLLVNQDEVPHYRVPVYNHLAGYLKGRGFDLTVAAKGVQKGNPHDVEFEFVQLPLTFPHLVRLLRRRKPHAVIVWVNLKHLYLFPLIAVMKASGIKCIYWGHGVDLLDREGLLKNAAYAFEHWLSDAIILYADHLRSCIPPQFHHKVFVANNTLNVPGASLTPEARLQVLKKYGIRTPKNIICMGRMEKRKRIGDLLAAFRMLNSDQYGLVLVGPDTDGSLHNAGGERIHTLGPVYGDDRLRLLAACDVFCLPGHVGLGIVDAFQCGLPLVTEDVDHAPEIMYLKDGINGFRVEEGDVSALAARLRLLLDDNRLRERFSHAARAEIATNGHIDVMCRGFSEALTFACGPAHRLR